MKYLGLVFIAIGLALFLFFLYGLIFGNKEIISPIPENKGVRVIFVSPTK